MFTLIEETNKWMDAQRRTQVKISKALRHKATRTIGYPSGHSPDADINHDGELWFHSQKSSGDATTPRIFNWFGIWGENEAASLNITVEINIPLRTSGRVAGCFVTDQSTGARYLAHSGAVGGGKRGVGQTQFLAWSNLRRVEVVTNTGKRRDVILVMPVDGPANSGVASLRSFVHHVASFKRAIDDGDLNQSDMRDRVDRLKAYYDEASGARRGNRSSVIDYISRHGDVVKALEVWSTASARPGTVSKKDIKIDLALELKGAMTDVFEVKTLRERGEVYKAIGQLMTHARGSGCRKHMVLPHGPRLPKDLDEALKHCEIALINYEINENGRIKITG
jgi:hypothetical protein